MSVKKSLLKSETGFPSVVSQDATHNMSGGQIQEVLDTLMYQSLTPIVLTSDVFDLQIIYLLGMTAKNKKRKLTALPREDFITALCHCLVTDDRQKKINILAASKIERGFVYNFVVNFLGSVDGYMDLYQKHMLSNEQERKTSELKLRAIERNLSSNRGSLYTAINTATDYLDLAYTFRNTIVNNYLRHSYKQARAFCKDKGDTFDFQCVYQNFLTSIIKAVDKYDCSKGALTSYINYWILNAQTTNNSDHGHEYGVAFTIPQVQRKAMAMDSSNNISNYSVSLDSPIESDDGTTELRDYVVGDMGVDIGIERTQEENNIRFLIKAADIKGMARLYLDVDECFSRKEKRKMFMTMKSQGIETSEVPDNIKR
jgi:hypothetical protein